MQLPVITPYKYSPPCGSLMVSLEMLRRLGLFLFFTATYAVHPPLCSPTKDEGRILLDSEDRDGLTHLLWPFESQEGRENSTLTDSKSMGWGIKKAKSK